MSNSKISVATAAGWKQYSVNALEQWTWDAAYVIRGVTDAPMYKNFIRPLIFFKRLFEIFDDELTAQKSIPLSLPDSKEQKNVTMLIALCYNRAAAIETVNALHEEFFRALLEEQMSGRLSILPLGGTASEEYLPQEMASAT